MRRGARLAALIVTTEFRKGYLVGADPEGEGREKREVVFFFFNEIWVEVLTRQFLSFSYRSFKYSIF